MTKRSFSDSVFIIQLVFELQPRSIHMDRFDQINDVN